MSPFLSSADLAVTDLGRHFRSTITVGDAVDANVAALFVDYATALRTGRTDVAGLIRDHAAAIDPGLVDELDGFDYPAAA
ncbi:hypothetical protein [Streptomyces cyanogenus]|uniref:Uncharacterized protein n=1 Tax=Streptomyces cyanogenus TaxID=80860 RepID=A0ABX7TK86_STRCY|nr:hypothetical protein [Streptomyces cyanogenus]QTD97001.1 hypothetical protein S1361_06530 [Streptomyces cyanogenus]